MFATLYVLLAQNDIFGTVTTPPGVDKFPTGPGGLVVFISNIIKLITVVAGIYGLFNIISAGYTYLSSGGNAKATEQAMNQLNYSLIGLMIIVGSFTITALISLLLFGDATYILNPKIPTITP
jgi:hypothetical protein